VPREKNNVDAPTDNLNLVHRCKNYSVDMRKILPFNAFQKKIGRAEMWTHRKRRDLNPIGGHPTEN
jgi:hypothetical protein